MYVCGPTVYNYIHIGNARPMIVFDTVRRYFEYKGYDVNFVSNFTDVDDKIIKKAIEEGTTSDVISKRFIEECKKDMAGMNVKPATKHPLATEEIDGMIDMIKTLIEKGHAYEKNGTVYFKTRSFKDYGKLSKKNIDDLDTMYANNKDDPTYLNKRIELVEEWQNATKSMYDEQQSLHDMYINGLKEESEALQELIDKKM